MRLAGQNWSSLSSSSRIPWVFLFLSDTSDSDSLSLSGWLSESICVCLFISDILWLWVCLFLSVWVCLCPPVSLFLSLSLSHILSLSLFSLSVCLSLSVSLCLSLSLCPSLPLSVPVSLTLSLWSLSFSTTPFFCHWSSLSLSCLPLPHPHLSHSLWHYSLSHSVESLFPPPPLSLAVLGAFCVCRLLCQLVILEDVLHHSLYLLYIQHSRFVGAVDQ